MPVPLRLLGLLLLVTACDGGDARAPDATGDTASDAAADATRDPAPDAGPAAIRFADPPDPDRLCSPHRMVALRPPEGACPAADHAAWSVSDLGEEDGERERFCVYEWTERDTEPDTGALPEGLTIDPDCPAVAGMGSPKTIREAVFRDFADAFRVQVGALDRLPNLAPLRRGPVRVAVLDTWSSFDEPGVTNWDLYHGWAMTGLLRTLVDPTGENLVSAYRALDLVVPEDGDPQVPLHVTTGEGRFGHQSRLALFIHLAVRDWANHEVPAGQTRPRLVINLSAGWSALFNEVDDPGRPGSRRPRCSVQAVRAALKYARCRGALVIAAAGNETGGRGGRDGPLFPAAWEQEPLGTCTGPGGEPTPPPDAPASPLVFAAGGVDYLDQPLATTRVGGRPRIAATASHAIIPAPIESGAGDEATPFLSGSSVAAAVTSAAAALVWRYQPELTASEVMDAVYAGSVPLGDPADFCLRPPCDDIRRVSVCGALRAAVPADMQGRVDCTVIERGQGAAPELPIEAVVAEVEEGARFDGSTLADVLSADSEAGQACGARELHYDGSVGLSVDPCPDVQYFSASTAPWDLQPQPPINGCDVCALYADGDTWKLYIGVSGKVSAMNSPVLVLSTGKSYDLVASAGAPSSLSGGAVYEIGKLSLSSFSQAFLSHTVTGLSGEKYSAVAELYLKK